MRNLPIRFLKSIAVITAMMFVVTDIAWSAPSLHLPRTTSAFSDQVKYFSASELRNQFPESLGSVSGSHMNPASSSIIFHIQDAHANYDAQKSIQNTIEYLVKTYNVDLLFMEGTEGKVDAELLHFFEDKDLSKALMDRLVKDGLAGGAELFLMDNKIEAYGLEDLTTYRENLEAYRSATQYRELTDKFLEKAKLKILTKGSVVFNEKLQAFFKDWALYQDQPADLIRHLEQLKNHAKQDIELDLEDIRNQLSWPQLLRIFKLRKLEERVSEHEDKVRDEGKLVLEWIQENELEAAYLQGMKMLVEGKKFKSESFQDIREFLEHFYDRTQVMGFSFEKYPYLREKLGMQILSEEMDAMVLFEEIEKLTDLILNKLAVGENEKQLVAVYKKYLLIEKAFALELTHKDYLKVKKNQADYMPSKWVFDIASINQNKEMSKGSLNDSVMNKLNKAFEKSLIFYKGAQAREKDFSESIFRVLKEKKKSAAIVISGGFHSKGLQKELKDNNASFIEITPRIAELGNHDTYRNAMTLEQSFEHLRSYAKPDGPVNPIGLNPNQRIGRQLAEASIRGGVEVALHHLGAASLVAAGFNPHPAHRIGSMRLPSKVTGDRRLQQSRWEYLTHRSEVRNLTVAVGTSIQEIGERLRAVEEAVSSPPAHYNAGDWIYLKVSELFSQALRSRKNQVIDVQPDLKSVWQGMVIGWLEPFSEWSEYVHSVADDQGDQSELQTPSEFWLENWSDFAMEVEFFGSNERILTKAGVVASDAEGISFGEAFLLLFDGHQPVEVRRAAFELVSAGYPRLSQADYNGMSRDEFFWEAFYARFVNDNTVTGEHAIIDFYIDVLSWVDGTFGRPNVAASLSRWRDLRSEVRDLDKFVTSIQALDADTKQTLSDFGNELLFGWSWRYARRHNKLIESLQALNIEIPATLVNADSHYGVSPLARYVALIATNGWSELSRAAENSFGRFIDTYEGGHITAEKEMFRFVTGASNTHPWGPGQYRYSFRPGDHIRIRHSSGEVEHYIVSAVTLDGQIRAYQYEIDEYDSEVGHLVGKFLREVNEPESEFRLRFKSAMHSRAGSAKPDAYVVVNRPLDAFKAVDPNPDSAHGVSSHNHDQWVHQVRNWVAKNPSRYDFTGRRSPRRTQPVNYYEVDAGTAAMAGLVLALGGEVVIDNRKRSEVRRPSGAFAIPTPAAQIAKVLKKNKGDETFDRGFVVPTGKGTRILTQTADAPLRQHNLVEEHVVKPGAKKPVSRAEKGDEALSRLINQDFPEGTWDMMPHEFPDGIVYFTYRKYSVNVGSHYSPNYETRIVYQEYFLANGSNEAVRLKNKKHRIRPIFEDAQRHGDSIYNYFSYPVGEGMIYHFRTVGTGSRTYEYFVHNETGEVHMLNSDSQQVLARLMPEVLEGRKPTRGMHTQFDWVRRVYRIESGVDRDRYLVLARGDSSDTSRVYEIELRTDLLNPELTNPEGIRPDRVWSNSLAETGLNSDDVLRVVPVEEERLATQIRLQHDALNEHDQREGVGVRDILVIPSVVSDTVVTLGWKEKKKQRRDSEQPREIKAQSYAFVHTADGWKKADKKTASAEAPEEVLLGGWFDDEQAPTFEELLDGFGRWIDAIPGRLAQAINDLDDEEYADLMLAIAAAGAGLAVVYAPQAYQEFIEQLPPVLVEYAPALALIAAAVGVVSGLIDSGWVGRLVQRVTQRLSYDGAEAEFDIAGTDLGFREQTEQGNRVQPLTIRILMMLGAMLTPLVQLKNLFSRGEDADSGIRWLDDSQPSVTPLSVTSEVTKPSRRSRSSQTSRKRSEVRQKSSVQTIREIHPDTPKGFRRFGDDLAAYLAEFKIVSTEGNAWDDGGHGTELLPHQGYEGPQGQTRVVYGSATDVANRQSYSVVIKSKALKKPLRITVTRHYSLRHRIVRGQPTAIYGNLSVSYEAVITEHSEGGDAQGLRDEIADLEGRIEAERDNVSDRLLGMAYEELNGLRRRLKKANGKKVAEFRVSEGGNLGSIELVDSIPKGLSSDGRSDFLRQIREAVNGTRKRSEVRFVSTGQQSFDSRFDVSVTSARIVDTDLDQDVARVLVELLAPIAAVEDEETLADVNVDAVLNELMVKQREWKALVAANAIDVVEGSGEAFLSTEKGALNLGEFVGALPLLLTVAPRTNRGRILDNFVLGGSRVDEFRQAVLHRDNGVLSALQRNGASRLVRYLVSKSLPDAANQAVQRGVKGLAASVTQSENSQIQGTLNQIISMVVGPLTLEDQELSLADRAEALAYLLHSSVQVAKAVKRQNVSAEELNENHLALLRKQFADRGIDVVIENGQMKRPSYSQISKHLRDLKAAVFAAELSSQSA